MLSIRVFSIALVFILVLVGDSSAHSQVMETTLVADGSGLVSAGKSLAKSGKDVNDANPAAAETGNSRLEVRKMMLKWGLDKKTVTVVEEGKVTNALNNQNGSSLKKFKIQNMLKANFESSASPEASRKHSVSKPVSDNGSSKCCSRSPPKLVPQESDKNSFQKLQPKRLLGDIKEEVMMFLNEDYQKQPSKPPVHNNKAPLGQEQAIPRD